MTVIETSNYLHVIFLVNDYRNSRNTNIHQLKKIFLLLLTLSTIPNTKT